MDKVEGAVLALVNARPCLLAAHSRLVQVTAESSQEVKDAVNGVQSAYEAILDAEDAYQRELIVVLRQILSRITSSK